MAQLTDSTGGVGCEGWVVELGHNCTLIKQSSQSKYIVINQSSPNVQSWKVWQKSRKLVA
eukprot:15367198-Ditylum_brightwellii.AAC.1